jgi:hypothetical protein
MTDPLTVGTGDCVTFPDVLVAGDIGLSPICLVNGKQVAVPPSLVPGGKHRRVFPSAPRQGRHPQVARHEPGAGVTSMDRYSPLRERMVRLRRSPLLLLGLLVAPLVMVGYVGLTVLLLLPLLGLRRMFPRRSTSSVLRWDSNAPLDLGEGNLWDAATRRA